MTASDDPVRPAGDSAADRPGRTEDRRPRRQRARRRTLQRRTRLAGALFLAAAVAVTALLLVGRSPGARSGAAQSRPRTAATTPHARRHVTPLQPAAPVRRPAPAPSPGSLPQTHAYPSGTGPRFRSLMGSLWSGIVGDSVAPALAAFFPNAAYVQLKAIYSASSDWTDRLVRDYRLDIAAAHQLLEPDPADARLVRVAVPAGYGHWVPPGVCYNSVGYYEVPNARVIYRENGQIRSFGIASMISWRGVWYVVHLGAILRPSDSGTVDEPAPGPGTSAYSGTC